MSASFLLLTGCTNFFIRQQCDKLNWYQLGYDAALRGERISNDQQVSQCRKAEAEISESQLDVGFKAGMARYCQPETAFQTGKQGDTLNSDFCEQNILGLLKRKFSEGNVAYCSDGQTAGQSGKKYKSVCSAELEKKFMPDYKIGRKKYLSNLLIIAVGKKRETASELSRVYSMKSNVENRLRYIPYVKAGGDDPYVNERNSLSSQASSLSNQLSDLNFKQTIYDKQITEYQTELATLN
jgi:hypothetical protein